jgi:transglutaminase-like putative cysteine protease
MDEYLEPTPAIDADHPSVVAYARAATAGASDARTRAIRLYGAVRDDVRYDPYVLDLSVHGMCASATLAARRGWCVSKAVLLAACARAEDIPARLGFADVRNHLSTERLRAAMGTDVFVYHGNTELWLGERWVKATPAFNAELCAKFGVAPLEFDGEHDSLLQEYDGQRRQFMEYVRDRGHAADLPLAQIVATFREVYPVLMDGVSLDGDFSDEGARERTR